MKKVKRPSISSAGTSEEWGYFVLRWGDYVTATRCQGPDRILQLLECCDEQLRRDLTRNAGGTLSGRTEEAVLEAIRNLAVREENPMVARVALHNMKQDREEFVRAFGARLRGQASMCRFVKVCTGCGADVNFSEENVADVLCRGLADPEIQQDLLARRKPEQNSGTDTVPQLMPLLVCHPASCSRNGNSGLGLACCSQTVRELCSVSRLCRNQPMIAVLNPRDG